MYLHIPSKPQLTYSLVFVLLPEDSSKFATQICSLDMRHPTTQHCPAILMKISEPSMVDLTRDCQS